MQILRTKSMGFVDSSVSYKKNGDEHCRLRFVYKSISTNFG